MAAVQPAGPLPNMMSLECWLSDIDPLDHGSRLISGEGRGNVKNRGKLLTSEAKHRGARGEFRGMNRGLFHGARTIYFYLHLDLSQQHYCCMGKQFVID